MSTLTIISNHYFDPKLGKYAETESFLEATKDPSKWTKIECGDDIMPALRFLFEKMPDTARLYIDQVAQNNDVTPYNEETIERLRSLKGDFFVVLYPQAPVVIIAIIIVVAVVAMAFLFQPKIPSPAMRNDNLAGSTNNELSRRTNEARPNSRIPEIVGRLRSTPDLLVVPFLRYVNNQEVEDVVLCIGRGSYTIHDARDGETSIYEIEGTSLQIYRPNTNINTGTPYFQIGPTIPDVVRTVFRSNSVNGQELKPSNVGGFTGDGDVRFEYPNIIRLYSPGNLKDIFVDGESIVVQRASEVASSQRTSLILPVSPTKFLTPYVDASQVSAYSAAEEIEMPAAFFLNAAGAVISLSGTFEFGSAQVITQGGSQYVEVTLVNPANENPAWNLIVDATVVPAGAVITHNLISSASLINFNGTYTIQTVAETWISLQNPAAINSNWNQLAYLPDQKTTLLSPILTRTGQRWIGPFVLENPTRTHISCNYVAGQGMYADDGKNQHAASVEIETEVTPVDMNNAPIGPSVTYTTTIIGSAIDKDSKGETLYQETATVGRIAVRARRITPENRSFKGTIVDQVKWKDLYGLASLTTADFGDVTVVRLRQWATTGALALKERKLNCLVTRELPRRIFGSDFTKELYPTRNAADILSFLALDPHNGGRAKEEVDFDNIYNTVSDVVAYFGTPLAAEFAYTIDSWDITFEDAVGMIASAIFCTAYRRGSVLRLSFERQTDRSTLLFNHRNKIPASETRTFTTGWENDNDGIEYQYTSPIDDALISLYLPAARTAINPKKYEGAGVRSKQQAWFHAWRLYNRLRHQYHSIEFNATQEAFLLLLGDRILAADNTKASTQNGEVIGQNGLILRLSQAVKFEPDKEYQCFLQLADGSVEGIRAFEGNGHREIVLERAPRLPLVFEDGVYARTTYLLSSAIDGDVDAFLVVDLDFKDNFTANVTAVNYDDRYYENDKDYIVGLIPPEI